jgi:two-component system, cell cycle response regulator
MINDFNSSMSSIGIERPGEASQRVLVVEDDAMFRKILGSWLESWGYQVTIAEDGTKAWAILQQEPAPQLLILDWMMPHPNGVELCRLIRERNSTPYQYILLLTAKDEKQDIIRGLEAGADDYLTKPFDKNELNARLRTGRRILTLQDEQIKIREQLQFQASHDALTGIWNRKAVLDLLHGEYDRVRRSKGVFGILMLDLDHFKYVNDTYGHQAGDEVLKEVGRRIQHAVRPYDWAGRYGGEEFLIVLPKCGKDEVQLCAERIRLAMTSEPILAEGFEIAVTVSIGSVVVNPALQSEKVALSSADTALYQAKSQGRDRIVALET